MKKFLIILLFAIILLVSSVGCSADKPTKIGIAFGVGAAARWPQEIQYMEEYAQKRDINVEARLNTDEAAKPLAKDCFELIDNGIDVLIVRPRDIWNMKEVVDYAHEHNVKVVSYDSLIENEPVDLFVGYDSEHIGGILGHYLSETVTSGDYILLWGDTNRNVEDMYRGAMEYLDPLKGQIKIILETGVPGWSPEEAKRIVKQTIIKNGINIDAILAFNDKLAGACREAITELGIEDPVAITGMDAELDAVQRIAAGTQACTAYMDLKELAYAAIDLAANLANNKKLNNNSETDNNSEKSIPTYLISRQLITKSNLDRILIESGIFTYAEVYGSDKQ